MVQERYIGRGIGVAILDTGIYPHKDFRGRIWAFHDFTANRTAPYDDNGHGTHVAGILAGDGRSSQGRIKGAAPGCGIIALKVLDRKGDGNREDVWKAFEWIRRNHVRYRIRVINISVGAVSGKIEERDQLLEGVEKLWGEGFVIVAAAGNQGPKPGSVTVPGSSKKIITVGSSDMLRGREGVSGRGPTRECVCKPDIVAPGYKILSCIPGGGYGRKSGTSMSTPVISGAIACLLEKYPNLTNREIKMRLRDSADDLGLKQNEQGWGIFNRKRFLLQ